MNEQVSATEDGDTKERIARERMIFIFGSAAMVAALKDDKTASREALRNGGAPVKERVLLATDRLRDWIAEMKE